jgi:hypothetical protein
MVLTALNGIDDGQEISGECYHGPEKYTFGHNATNGVFLLELDDEGGTEAVVDELGISMHGPTGIDVADTMKSQEASDINVLVSSSEEASEDLGID